MTARNEANATPVRGCSRRFTWYLEVPNMQSIVNSYCEVQSFTNIDLYAQYAFTKNFTVHGAILNVFGQQPPIDMTTYGASGNDPYNPAMHQMGAVSRFFNVGGTYTF
jgi:iron complex outermembrane receptor protein